MTGLLDCDAAGALPVNRAVTRPLNDRVEARGDPRRSHHRSRRAVPMKAAKPLVFFLDVALLKIPGGIRDDGVRTFKALTKPIVPMIR